MAGHVQYTKVALSGTHTPDLDTLVFIMLRCLRAFAPYSDENTVLGSVLNPEGEPSSVDIWKEAVNWGIGEQGGVAAWPKGKRWLGGSVREVAIALLDNQTE